MASATSRRLRPPVAQTDVLKAVIRNSEVYLSRLNAKDLESVEDYVAEAGSKFNEEAQVYVSYENLNNVLYNPERPDIDDDQRLFFKRWGDRLQNVLTHAPKAPADFTVYRGVSEAVLRTILERLQPGDILDVAGFASTSVNPVVATNFVSTTRQNPLYRGKTMRQYQQIPEAKRESYFVDLKHACCMMQILIPKGTPVLYMTTPLPDSVLGEEEVVLPAGSAFRFVGPKRVQKFFTVDKQEIQVETYPFRGGVAP